MKKSSYKSKTLVARESRHKQKEKKVANENVVAMLCAGQIAEFNAWRQAYPGIRLNLIGANFSGAHLVGTNFSGMFLMMANFNDANLGKVNFNGADLGAAKFIEANLVETSFIEANLVGANFYKAKGLSSEIQEQILSLLRKSWE